MRVQWEVTVSLLYSSTRGKIVALCLKREKVALGRDMKGCNVSTCSETRVIFPGRLSFIQHVGGGTGFMTWFGLLLCIMCNIFMMEVTFGVMRTCLCNKSNAERETVQKFVNILFVCHKCCKNKSQCYYMTSLWNRTINQRNTMLE